MNYNAGLLFIRATDIKKLSFTLQNRPYNIDSTFICRSIAGITHIIICMEFKQPIMTVFVQNFKHSILHNNLITSHHLVVGLGLL